MKIFSINYLILNLFSEFSQFLTTPVKKIQLSYAANNKTVPGKYGFVG